MSTLLRVKVEGLESWCDACRYDHGLVFLSVFGPRNAVRAAWARAMKDRNRGHIEIADQYLRRDDADYTSMSSVLPGGDYHWVLVHHDATQRVSPFANGFYLVSPEPAQDFFLRLNRLCAMPLRPSWAPELWLAGQESSEEHSAPIRALAGHGLPGYYVSADVDVWHRVVRDLLAAGRIR